MPFVRLDPHIVGLMLESALSHPSDGDAFEPSDRSSCGAPTTKGYVVADDGTRLYYEVIGDGDQTIVINDGIACDRMLGLHLTGLLSRDYRIVHWNYRGHGLSAVPEDRERVGIPILARDLEAVLDAAGVDEVHVAGFSMGTQVSLEFYRWVPDRVLSLSLFSGSYGHITRTFRGTTVMSHVLPKIIELTRRHPGLTERVWTSVPAAMAYTLAGFGGEIDAGAATLEDFSGYWEHVRRLDPSLFLPMLRQAGEHTAWDLLPRIDVPTLVVAGARDHWVPADVIKSMADEIRGATFVLVPHATHAVPFEQPRALHAHLRRLIEVEVPKRRRPRG